MANKKWPEGAALKIAHAVVDDLTYNHHGRRTNALLGLLLHKHMQVVLVDAPEVWLSKSSCLTMAAWNKGLKSAFRSVGLLKEDKPKLEIVPVLASPAPVQTPAPIPTPANPPVPAPGAVEGLLRQLAAAMQNEINQASRRYIDERLRAGLQDYTMVEDEQIKAAVRTGSAGTTSVTRVFVVGLTGIQQHIVDGKVRELGIPAELRFVDHYNTQAKATARWADHIVVMTRHVSTDVYNALEKAGGTMHRCQGSVSDLIRTLAGILGYKLEQQA